MFWRAVADKALHLALPALCMILFWLTPGGAEGWLYALYWTIPMVLCFVSIGVVGRALKSTLIAHAIGSVMWAYVVPLSGSAWMSLIPVVAVERFFTTSWSLVVVGLLYYAREGLSISSEESRVAPAISNPRDRAIPENK